MDPRSPQRQQYHSQQNQLYQQVQPLPYQQRQPTFVSNMPYPMSPSHNRMPNSFSNQQFPQNSQSHSNPQQFQYRQPIRDPYEHHISPTGQDYFSPRQLNQNAMYQNFMSDNVSGIHPDEKQPLQNSLDDQMNNLSITYDEELPPQSNEGILMLSVCFINDLRHESLFCQSLLNSVCLSRLTVSLWLDK